MEILQQFSNYIINTFFTYDKKGESVSVVIDKQLMEDIALKMGTSRKHLVKQLSLLLFNHNFNSKKSIDSVISIVALQLYAASECESDNQYTVAAYNPRLCEIINLEINHLQAWYRNNQEDIWKYFYQWCKNNHFDIQTCQPKEGKNKYIQYPLELANHCLNREDFKYITSLFNKYGLQPNEDISYNDFWKVIRDRDFQSGNKHIQTVFNAVFKDTKSYEIVKYQIYNFYTTWNGEYFSLMEGITQKSKDKFQIHLSNKDEEYRIDIRCEDGSKIVDFLISPNFREEISQYYSYKRSDTIIFQQDIDGDPNYWDETRFIRSKNEIGLALVFNGSNSHHFYNANIVFHSRNLAIYELKFNNRTKEYYSDNQQSFEFIGGLKLAHNTYLVEGEPILRLLKDNTYIMDGEVHIKKKGDHPLTMSIGIHTFKFHRSKELKIRIIPQTNKQAKWDNTFQKWDIKRWMPSIIENGIVGLDFSQYAIKKPVPILKQWTKCHNNKRISPENNISLILLDNINKYE